MELIDRAAVIAAIKSYCVNCDNYSGVRCRSCGYMDAMDKVDEVPTVDALEQIELLEEIIVDKEKSPWISVEEMLPLNGEKVVVSDGVHTWDYGQYKGFLKDKHTWWWKNMTPRTVHWWMSKKGALPEPPKE